MRCAALLPPDGLAMTVSALPTLLCCTPVMPTLLATAGLSAISVYSTTSSLQRFFALHQTAFFAFSLALLAATGWWSLRPFTRAECLTGAGCGTEAAPPESVTYSARA